MKLVSMIILAVLLIGTDDAMARGGGRAVSSGADRSARSTEHSSSSGSKSAKDVEEPKSGGMSIRLDTSSRRSSGSGSYDSFDSAGNNQGGKTAQQLAMQPALSPEEEKKRRERQLEYEKKIAEEGDAIKAAKALLEEERLKRLKEAEERKLAAEKEAQRKADLEARERAQAAWEARCVIKPVMTDEEIGVCREVRTKPAPL